MLIRDKLSISVAVSLGAAVFIGAILFHAVQRVQQEAVQNQAHLELVKHLSEQRFAMVDFVNFGQERARLQWESSHHQIDRVLSQVDSTGIDAEALARVRRNQLAAQSVFDRLVTTSTEAGGRQDRASEELRQRLVSQLMGRTQDMTFDALRLGHRSIAKVHAALHEVALLVVLVTALGVALVAANWFIVWKNVLQPMKRLEAATARIATGDEVARTGLDPRADELGSLSRSFDAMAESLQQRAAKLQTANRDLTSEVAERKRMEEEVRAASLYARSLIEASLDPLVTISAEGKVTDVNKASEQVTGVTRERLIGSDFSDYFAEPEKARAGYKQVFADGYVKDYPLAIRHRSGAVTHVLYNASVYRNEAGEVQGVFAAARDITERKTMEEKVRAASLYARSLIEASLDPLVTISPEGEITDVNKASEQVTGVTRERLIGSDFSDYFTEPEKASAGYKRVFSDGFVTDYPLAIRHRSGGVTQVLYNASVYKNEAGEVQGVFAAARDITVQREAEAALRVEAAEREKANDALETSARDLARSNAELEQFAYVASHDLQEPLRMVVGHVQLLEKRLAEKLDADTREFMGFAVDGALRMQHLIQDILAYSRVGTGGRPLDPVDSGAALKEALALLASRIAETGAEVNAQPLPIVTADRGQLVQLLQNLIGNAIKFCKDRAPRVQVAARREAGRWRFSVSDNGIGIAAEYRERIFGIFQRLHTRREFPGTGIGLAICKRIVERHGGEIGVESEPDGGSVFWFTLAEEECT